MTMGQAFVPVRVPSEADFGEDGDDFLDDPLPCRGR